MEVRFAAQVSSSSFFFLLSVCPALSFARGALGRMRRCWAGLAEEAEARGKLDGDAAASGDAAEAEGKKVQQQRDPRASVGF